MARKPKIVTESVATLREITTRYRSDISENVALMLNDIANRLDGFDARTLSIDPSKKPRRKRKAKAAKAAKAK